MSPPRVNSPLNRLIHHISGERFPPCPPLLRLSRLSSSAMTVINEPQLPCASSPTLPSLFFFCTASHKKRESGPKKEEKKKRETSNGCHMFSVGGGETLMLVNTEKK